MNLVHKSAGLSPAYGNADTPDQERESGCGEAPLPFFIVAYEETINAQTSYLGCG